MFPCEVTHRIDALKHLKFNLIHDKHLVIIGVAMDYTFVQCGRELNKH